MPNQQPDQFRELSPTNSRRRFRTQLSLLVIPEQVFPERFKLMMKDGIISLIYRLVRMKFPLKHLTFQSMFRQVSHCVVNQNAVVDAGLKAGGVQETVTVTENASLLNTTTAEVSTRFDEKRLSELPDFYESQCL